MNETDIRKYATLMQELGLTGLEITENNKAVRLERTIPGTVRESVVIDAVTDDPISGGQAAERSSSGNHHTQQSHNTNYISVKSPIVGVFYAAPAENADPFVSIGDYVEKGKTLCIIEAMKLMNEIFAEDSGEILEICAVNGQVVEYGTELFRIRR